MAEPNLPPPEWIPVEIMLKADSWPYASWGVKVITGSGECRLWTKNAPGMDQLCGNKTFQRGPGLLLPKRDAAVILNILRKARITPFSEGMKGCDGTTYQLRISHENVSMTLGWWVVLPEGWKGLEPLLKILHRYASKCGQKPKQLPPED